MITDIILTLEIISVLLVCLLLFKIRSHYLLSSALKLKAQQKSRATKRLQQSSIKSDLQYKPASPYYYHKLPEPEVSISSEQEIAPFTNSMFLRKITNKVDTTNSTTKPSSVSQSTHKAILNNYIDDFFSSSVIEVAPSSHKPFANPSISAPANDEIITVDETNEMV